MKSKILSQQELRIYSQQIILPQIGLSGQEKLKLAKVMVIGAGGLGMTVLQNLSSLGIGVLGIADNSLIQEADLPRYTHFGIQDIGKQKTISAKEKLKRTYPKTDYNIHNICISDKNTYQICTDYDIVVDATKNLPTSEALNTLCHRQHKPLVWGYVVEMKGMVTVFHYKGSHLFKTILPELKAMTDKKNETLAPLVPLAGIAGSYMALEVFKIILKRDTELNKKILKIYS